MRRTLLRSLVSLVALTLTLAAAPLAAQEEGVIVVPRSRVGGEVIAPMPAGETLVAAESGLSRLESKWFQWMSAFDADDKAIGKMSQDALFDVTAKLDLARLTDFSSAAVALARRATGGAEKSAWALELAGALDPLNAEVPMARFQLAAGRKDWASAAKAYAAAYRLVLANPRTRATALRDAIALVAAAVVLTALALAVVLALKYARPMYHDAWEMFSEKFPGPRARVLGMVLLGLPLFLWLGFYWLAAYLLALSLVYASVRERVLGLGLLAAAAAAIPLADRTSYRALVDHSPVVAAAQALEQRQLDPRLFGRIEALIVKVPSDADLLFLRGNLQQQAGQFEGAKESYQEAIAARPGFDEAIVDLGNIHFGENQLQLAIQNYKQAIQANPGLAAAHFNLSRAYSENNLFKESEQAFLAAKSADEVAVSGWVGEKKQKIVTLWLPVERARRIVADLTRGKAGEAVRKEVYGHYRTYDILTSLRNEVTLAGIAGVLLGIALVVVRRGKHAGECIKCGRTFCLKCKRHDESSVYCSQCIHIYLKKGGVSVETKVAKLEEVKSFQRFLTRWRKIVSAILPGSGQLIAGRTVRGVVLLLCASTAVAALVLRSRLLPQVDVLLPWRDPLVTVVAIAVLIVVWLSANLPVWREGDY